MIKRYNIDICDVCSTKDPNIKESENGDWIKYEDYHKLFKLFGKYIHHIIDCDGSDYIEALNYEKENRPTDEEIKLLFEIKEAYKSNLTNSEE